MADFYLRTAASLDKVVSNTQSVKAAASPHHDSKRVLALLVNTLAYRTPFTQILQQVDVAHLERKAFPDRSISSGEATKNAKGKTRAKDNGRSKQQTLQPAPSTDSKEVGSSNGKPARPAPSTSTARPNNHPTNASLLLVLAHDLLFSARGIQAAKSWPPKVAIERHRARLHSDLVRLQLQAGKARIQDLRAGALTDSEDGRSFDEIIRTIPRWARVNELKTSVEFVKSWLSERGWKEVGVDGQRTELKAGNEFAVSSLVPSLLAFPPKATSTLLASELYRDGLLVLQDLASCMPTQILNPLEWEVKAAATSGSMGKGKDGSKKRKRKAEGETLGTVDATSAPGNKTSHLSALMQGQGHLTAFERSAPRYKILTKLLGRSGALASSSSPSASKDNKWTAKAQNAKALGNVTTFNQDFLQTDPEDALWQDVRYMLVDPSCSGSGIVNRLDYLKGDDEDDAEEVDEVAAEDPGSVKAGKDGRPTEEATTDNKETSAAASPDEAQERKSKKQQRLEKLADFQLLMIRHAMRFPNLQRLVYSTCSIHAEENEHVVLRALQCQEASTHGWTLAPRSQVLPGWPVRGKVEECEGNKELADSVIRCIPGGTPFAEGHFPNTESCNGFFVACFVKNAGEQVREGVADLRQEQQVGEEDGDQGEGEDEEARKKRRKTKVNRKKAEQKKRKEKERKMQQQQQQQKERDKA